MQFVNFLSYRAEAQYPAGMSLAAAGLCGVEAYGRYGVMALEHVVRRGGMLTLYNDVLQTLIGQMGPWDQVVVIQYPDTDAFVKMMRDPDYQAGAGAPRRRPGRDGHPGLPSAALTLRR